MVTDVKGAPGGRRRLRRRLHDVAVSQKAGGGAGDGSCRKPSQTTPGVRHKWPAGRHNTLEAGHLNTTGRLAAAAATCCTCIS